MTINVYESIMPGRPVEQYDCHGVTVSGFIGGQSENYKPGSVQPITCSINGEIISPDLWCETTINKNDIIEIRPRPAGSDTIGNALFPGVYSTFQISRYAVNKIIQSQLPDYDNGSSRAGQRGQGISVADVRANVARKNEIIPEGVGRYIRYGDYLNQPRRYYKDTRTQCLDIFICIGAGYYLPELSTLKIGDTQISTLTNDYRFFDPGESVTTHQAHKNWYPSTEVGSTTGSAGIRLQRGQSLSSGLTGILLDRDGNEIRTTASNYFPGDWSVGDYLSVSLLTGVSISSDVITVTTGDFNDFDVGSEVLLRSSGNPEYNGTYSVSTINAGKTEMTLNDSAGDPAVFVDGSYGFYLSNLSYEYRITDTILESGLYRGFVVSLYIGGVEQVSWPGFPDVIGSADVLLAERSESEGWAGPFTACPVGEVTNKLELDFLASSGLGTINDDGDVVSRTRTIEVQWRPEGTAIWDAQQFNVNGATRDQLGWTFEIDLATSMRPEVRVRRVQAEDTATNSLDRLEWLGLRAELPTRDKYDNLTTLALTIEGTDQVASLSENQINVIVTRMLQPYNGGAMTPTRRIADAFYYVAKSVGYTDDEIDMGELDRLNTVWQSRGDTFDYFFSETTVKGAMDSILAAGFSALTVDTGALLPVRDEPRTGFEQGYSRENTTNGISRSFESVQVDEFDGVEVTYTDATTFTEEVIICTLPGDLGIKLEKISLVGVTSRTRAWRIGMRRRREQRYRRWTYLFQTELDAMNSQYLSYVPLVDNVPGYGAVSILRQAYTDRIVVSEPLVFEAGKSHVIAYRNDQGEIVGPFPATQHHDKYTAYVEIPAPLPENKPDREQVQVYFGTTERWSFPALITDISPAGQYSLSVTGVNYDDRIYADDDNSPE